MIDKSKIFVELAFIFTLIFSTSTLKCAEAGVIVDHVPFSCYVDHQVNTYNQPGDSQRAGYISPNVDLITVTQVRHDGWAYGSYPGSGGKRVERWFRISELCADPAYSNRSMNVSGSRQVFRTQNSNEVFGSVSNESVIVLADKGSRLQILYRLNNGSGYKVGWIVNTSIPPQPIPNPNKGFPSSIYLTQVGNNTCTLVSAAMMLRAKAYLNGNNSWSSITESAIKNTAWSGGLKWSWSYMGMSVAHSKTSGISSATLKSLLDQHPEGIVLHCANLQRMHAVWVMGYSGNTFYCSDPLSGYSGDCRPLANSYIGKQCGNNQDRILAQVTAYWYVQ
ncbi:MAG: hypothetical protein IKZ58_05450 [Selenomonadaceae bacterium]|nr:hypothetical protein [Selenomonadaceae bacterium]